MQTGDTTSLRVSTLRKFLAVCLALLLVSACLTTRGGQKAPAFRALKPSENYQLDALNDPSWKAMKPKRRGDSDASPEKLAELAEVFFHRGQYESALMNYYQALSQEPQRHDIRLQAGRTLLLLGRLEDAKRELAEVLIHQPEVAEAHEALGLAFLQENHTAEAQRELRAALALDPRRLSARSLLGEAYLQAEQYSQAAGEFRQALDLSPENPRIMSNLGWALFKMKQTDQALTWLQKARALAPQDSRSNHRLGMVLADQKKFPEALAAFRQAGDEAQAFNNIGVHYFLEERYAEAARCFQKALDLRPTYYQEARVNLDKALARLREQEAAGE